MKIFELLNTNPNQPLADPDQDQQGQQNPEDDSQGKFDANKVDQNLQDLAQGVDDQNAQPEPQGGMQGEPPELDSQNVKPIDDALLQQIKSLPYATKYNIKDKSPISPMKIAAMQVQDLSSLKDLVRFKIQTTMMKNQVGLDDDPNMEYYSDLLRFVNTVMGFKKTNTKSQLAMTNPTPAYQNQNSSK